MTKGISATTSADTSLEFRVTGRFGVTVAASSLGASEEIAVEIEVGGSYEATDVVLTADIPALMVVGIGKYRINKPVTAGAVAVEVRDTA